MFSCGVGTVRVLGESVEHARVPWRHALVFDHPRALTAADERT
jgi:hypothetical protein